ncbi:hypothetical protein SAMN05421676_103269 [Salinibacillus kushneri]|uniref:YwdI family protein n=1 Tax=Salinibacillus kushneri TaxID=237682 RepID=A0A1I0CRS3_9BACI|nr:YwdI family protein [Salinibacillus kushneri]SET22443.1 hypothetical protein SAMN05421676_103269 [Salinibacillus kushneri]
MPVPDRKVLQKMLNEVQQAMDNAHDPSKMKEHIKSVRLLTDLFIDEETTTSETEVMLKLTQEQNHKRSSHQVYNPGTSSPSSPGHQRESIDHDDANGDSIFDF